jgi:N12 class adenine-specific DNA methylase
MQSYLQPDVLDAAGVRVFDSWAATFGRTHTALELAPDGASYRMKTRFARFQNAPELLGLYHQVADVRTAEDLGLPTPELAGGKAETVVVPRATPCAATSPNWPTAPKPCRPARSSPTRTTC